MRSTFSFSALHHRPAVRTTLSCVFILFMLASAHLLMVIVNRAEHAVAAPQPSAGLEARLISDRPLVEELEGALHKSRSPTDRAVLEAALNDARNGKPVPLRTLPVTPFLAKATLLLTLLGALLVWLTSRLKGDAAQSIVGVFAGNLLWTGAVEYGLTIGARALGIAKTVGVMDGELVGIYGEYVLMKHSWGGFALVMAYLLFLESSRCPVFLVARAKAPVMRGPIASGRIDNFGPRTAFQYATTVWGFYLLLLWAYDEDLFGVHGVFTKLVLFGALAGTLYCTYRLHQTKGWGPAVRYAIGAMIVAWTPIEIAGKWGVFREPWLLLEPETLVIFFGGLAVGTWMLWRAQRRPSTSKTTLTTP
jgi:hypothetical protein